MRRVAVLALFILACGPTAATVDPKPDGGQDAAIDAPVSACLDEAHCPPSTTPCSRAVCDGVCGIEPVSDGTPCDGGMVCVGGECAQAGAKCMTAVDCNDNDHCTTDFCYEASGTCGHFTVDPCLPLPECTGSVDCDDGNPCTIDTCYTFGGTCGHGFANDGDPCGADGTCLKGQCI